MEQTAKEGDYFAEALLYQSFTLRRLGGSLNEILELIDRSAQVNDYYADIAIGNRFVTYIDLGQLKDLDLDQYLSWAEGREDIYIGLPHMLEGFVNSGRLDDAHKLLNRFQYIFDVIPPSEELFKLRMYLHFRYALALFRCARNEMTEGLHELLDVANKAFEFGNLEKFKQCIKIYWKYKSSYH